MPGVSITSLEMAFELSCEAELALGQRAWRMVSIYGRVMSGPYVGRYVSGLPFATQRDIVQRLAAGETLAIHLMHRHQSGNHESSCVRWAKGQLTMVFKDREVPA